MTTKISDEVKLVGLFGTGGCGRSAMPVATRYASSLFGVASGAVVFVDDDVTERSINGHDVLSFEEFSARRGGRICIAVADSKVRQELVRRCESGGLGFFNVLADNAEILDSVQIAEGSMVLPFATLGSNTTIGRHFQANLYSYIEHDCVVGDFVTLAPGAKCNGNVEIRDHAYLGAGCVIRNGRPGKRLVIGEAAIVGMGAVVTRDVPAGTTVVGNPARPIQDSKRC